MLYIRPPNNSVVGTLSTTPDTLSVGSRNNMKWNQISVVLVAGILACGTVRAGATDTNVIITIESTQSRLQPQTGVTYRIAANWIYKTDDPGPAEIQNSSAWHLANEFVFRTSLRDLFALPASSSGKRKEDDLYSVTFARKAGGKELMLLVDQKRETIQMKEDN